MIIPFAIIAFLHLLAAAFQWPIMFITKPLLMPSLAVWWLSQSKGSAVRGSVLLALLFSTLGDILLMRSEEYVHFFLLGLASFLVAHWCYLYSFRVILGDRQGILSTRPLLVLPFILYLLCLLGWLWPGIPAAMKIPVGIYAITITLMAMLAFHVRSVVTLPHANWLFTGAVFFVLSDSLIAVHKFGHPFAGAPFAIIATYILGQYGIVRGVIGGRQA